MDTKKYYKEESKIYDLKRFTSPVGKHIDNVEKSIVFKNLKGKNVLELCCGTGRFATYLANKGFKYYGIDFSQPMLDEAISKNKIKGNVTFKRLDVKDLGTLTPNTFNSIFTARAIKFWQNPQQVIDDCYNLLKDGGRIILCFQSKDKSLVRGKMKVGTEKY